MSSSGSATPSSSHVVTEELRRLYGDAALLEIPCVFHVVALWQPPTDGVLEGERRVMHILPATPRSDTDTFVLSLARARAQAIITTGRILREEPHVRYEPLGPRAAALLTWRREVLGLSTPPRIIVLSRGPLPPHPGLGPTAERLDSDLLTAIKTLQDQGVSSICVEAGPTTARALYAPGSPLRQLMLSTCQAAALPAAVIGPPLVPEATLQSCLPRRTPPHTRDEAGIPWTFELRSVHGPATSR